MLLLTSTSDKIQLITSSTAPLKAHATYVDNHSGSITPGRANVAIASIATTDLVGSPASGDQRNVQTMLVRNSDASVTNTVTVRHTDGTTPVDVFQTALGPGETLQYLDGVGFQVITAGGAVKRSQNQGANASSSALSVAVLAADVTNNNATANTIADVTGLSFPVTAGKKYFFRFVIQYTAAATTTGSRWSINGPGATAMRYRSEYSLTTTSQTINEGVTAHDTPAAASASSAATAGNVAVIEGIYEASATGTVIARFASEITASAIVAKAGSVVYYQEVA